MINFTVSKAIFLTALIVLTACNQVSSPSAPVENDTCRKEELSKLLWRPEAALESVDLKNVRVIRPGMAVTMDFRSNRTNIAIGESGRIERVYCG